MMELLRSLAGLGLAPVSEGTDRAIALLCAELPFRIHEYPSQAEHNGWVVPMKWQARKAEIRRDGRLIYDGMAHPLGVIGSSQSFSGNVDLAELQRHLFFHPTIPDALVYHCDLYYKVGRRDWGFTVPRALFDGLSGGTYAVDLRTEHSRGTMKVADFHLPGSDPRTIVLNAHDCHAAQANDDIAGIVVGVEVLKRLRLRRNRRFSYRLIVAPEHFGTVFYLAGLDRSVVETFRYCMFLEMLGSQGPLALQETFTGASLLDRAAHHWLHHNRPDHRSDRFRRIVGNDETVWEAPGFEIPTISLSRFPYPEYHSSKDDQSIIRPAALEDAVESVLGIIDILERDVTMQRTFDGLVALSNPKYDLYISQADPSIRPSIPDDQRRWNYLMDCLPRYFEGKMTVLEVAERHELPFDSVLRYVERFQAKGLVRLVPAS